MVVARTEALIAGLGRDEALRRGAAYAEAGADAVLIHSNRFVVLSSTRPRRGSFRSSQLNCVIPTATRWRCG